MTPQERDPAYLWDMLQAARSILQFTQGMTESTYLASRLVQRAVEREFEILGEAARRVSEPFQRTHPEISWARIIAHRNVLAHEYGEIRHERIWIVIQARLTNLALELEKLIPPE